jgi:hypothetical protein
MMLIADFILAFIIAAIISAVLAFGLGWERPGRAGLWPSFLFIFFILLVVTWAGGVWVTPFGTPVWGVYWLPFVVVGLILALVLLAISPPRRPRTRREAVEQSRDEREASTVIGGFFWVMLLALGVAIVTHYVA